jgi:hypothetical protein
MNHIREELFDTVSIKPTGGSHLPDQEWLHRPFEMPTTVALRFCRSCAASTEIDESRARELATRAGAPFADTIPRGIYFEGSGCVWCTDGDESPVEIKNIP